MTKTEEPHFCDHPGCWSLDTLALWFPSFLEDKPEPEPDRYYCGKHMAEHGFCKICGSFWGGIESFHFHHPGICDNCWSEFEADEGGEDFWESGLTQLSHAIAAIRSDQRQGYVGAFELLN